jgi:hypothetical protein
MDGVSVPRAAGLAARRLPGAEQTGFADLVYTDSAWLRAEFDAIIAANFDAAAEEPLVPSYRPPRGARERRGRPGDAARMGGPAKWPVCGDRARTARQVGARERSPPPICGSAVRHRPCRTP